MTERERTWYESIKVEGGQLLDKVAEIIREGNVRRIVIRQGDHTVAEFPLTVGVVGAVFAPILAAVGALAALIGDCSIVIERVAKADGPAAGEEPAAGAPAAEPPVEEPRAQEPPSSSNAA